MKFKISMVKEPIHQGHVTSVCWSSAEEVYSCGDDNQLIRWNVATTESSKITDFRTDIFPTDMQWIPRGPSYGKHNDLILLIGSDGRFHLINRNGRIEKSVDAHSGAILVGKWCNDGSGLLTAGEDGQVKIWSRSGMLRSIFASNENPVYAAFWSPDSMSIAYTQAKTLIIKPLAPNTKPVKWKAHDGLILCIAWSPSVNLIVSGAEDCRYKVWDPEGRLMFTSSSHDYPITAVSWAPPGDLFAIGAFNTLRLCDSAGWSHCLEKIDNIGSLYNIAWSQDGTQLTGACASGHVLFAHVIDRYYQWQNFVVRVTGKKTIHVKDILNEIEENLDLNGRIIKVAIGFGYLIATTPSQCYIYSITNWNTPTIFDLKDGSVNHILLAEKYFIIVERKTVTVYTYQSRLIVSPKWQAMNPEYLTRTQITLSSDTLVLCDQSDSQVLHIFDLGLNRSIQDTGRTIRHDTPVTHVALNQAGSPVDRQLALVDLNKDVFLVAIRGANVRGSFVKLSTQILSLCWNTEYNMLAAIQDTCLLVWYTPGATYISSHMLKMSSLQYDSTELGRGPQVVAFSGTGVAVRRADGSLLNIPISVYTLTLYDYVFANKWSDTLNLCRMVQDFTLWACLAVLATHSTTDALDAAEEAYAAINLTEKVVFIQNIKNMRSKPMQLAYLALLGGSMAEAETILLQNGLVYQAINMNVKMHNWLRALDLAIKHKTHIDTVLYLRQKYVHSMDKQENNTKFLTLKDSVEIDENKVEEKIRMENNKI